MENMTFIFAEIVLAVSGLVLLLVGAFGGARGVSIVRYLAIAAILLFALSGVVISGQGEVFGGAFISDAFSQYVKALIGFTSAAALWFSRSYFKAEGIDKFEYSILMIFAVLGMGIMVSAGNLLSLYVGLEMQSLALYVMAAFNRKSLRASEAGLKYFVLGALSSGLLLYGISLIYGFTGTLGFDDIAKHIGDVDANKTGIVTGLVFLLAGLAFKISAAPFHMWAPDVYEGAPTPVTGFFASAPKLAALALITRIVVGPFSAMQNEWQQVIVVLAVLSLIVGTFGALTQTNIKRLLGYSSIANMGYALVALAAGGVEGVTGLLIFMTIYLLTVVGTFACILQMRTTDGMVEKIQDLGGVSKSNMTLAVLLTALMFSLAGIPFFLGFFAKWFAFLPAYNAGLVWLVVVALLASVIAAFYYLRVIKTMWFDEQEHVFVKAAPALAILSTLSAIVLMAGWMMPFLLAPARALIDTAANSLF